MSLNKFTNVETGYDLKLDVGCDELKCNSLEVGGNVIDELESGTYNPNIYSGTPTLSALPVINYLKVGNTLTVHGSFSIQDWLTAGNTVTFEIGLPIAGFQALNVIGTGTGTTSVGSVSAIDDGLSTPGGNPSFNMTFTQIGGNYPVSGGELRYSASFNCA